MLVTTVSSGSYVTASIGDKSKDRVIINVGGTRHECYISTIQNFPDTRLYWIAETALKMADFDPEGNEFFFDRHPGCFQNILNYCRTGKLHCPNDVCGPLFEQELGFWGVDELMMEPCCWGNYTQHREAHKNLKMFDQMHATEEEDDMDEEELEKLTKKIEEMGPFRKRVADIRQKTWCLLEQPFSSLMAQFCALVSMFIIIMSIASFCLETMPHFRRHKLHFERLEYVYCAYFTVEFLVRLFCCPSLIKFFKSAMTWIDIISTAQFYIGFWGDTDALEFLFVTRMIRIFRLFRFFKSLSGMQVIGQTLKASANELFLLVLIVFIPMVMFSTLMFYAERNVHDTDFQNIPETFWWAIITMTTVGYGDNVPKSTYGKMIGTLCACSGVLIVALPVSVIGSNFTLYYSYAQARIRLPQRRSPALVSADKALLNNNSQEQTNDSPTSLNTYNNKAIPHSLEGVAAVMVDLALPMRERRHAIQPSTNPISKALKQKIHKHPRKSVSTALTSLAVPLTLKSPLTSPDASPSDIKSNNEGETIPIEKPSPRNYLNTRNKSLPLLPPARQEKNCLCPDDDDALLKDTKRISKSEEGELSFEVTRSPRERPRRVLHVDIGKYVPRKVSVAEHKARRKLSHHCHKNGDKSTLSLELERRRSHPKVTWMLEAEQTQNGSPNVLVTNHLADELSNQNEPLLP